MTDIVERLRIPIIEIGLDAHFVDWQRQKAADEIERLRAALREIAGLPYSQERDNTAQDWAREALGDD